jgi:hypothetical protein
MSQRVHDYVDRARLVVDDMQSSLPEEITIEEIYDESSTQQKNLMN